MDRQKLFHRIKDQRGWKAYANQLLLKEERQSPKFVEQFSMFWIEAGHHLREQVEDDRTLVCLLRYLLPPYKGEALELFRGENRSRWESGSIGLAWTRSIDTARIFGSGLNAINSGGVLLKSYVIPEVIISGPNAHSIYLGENQFTVDPYSLSEISVLEAYPTVE